MPARKLGENKEIPLQDYSPDLDPTTPGICLDHHNAVPTVKGFAARNAPVLLSTAAPLPGTPIGGYVALYSALYNNHTSIFAATKSPTHIYRLSAGNWVQVDSLPPIAATNPWNFFQFADDVIAVNAGLTMPLVAPGYLGVFTPLGGSPPSGVTTGISVAGFAAMYVGNEWFNSSAGTDTGWTPNVQTQSGSGFLYDFPGNITAAAPFFRNQVVWKNNAMWLLSYIGGTQVWSSELISVGTGTWSQGCVIQGPEALYFLGTDDFYQCQGYAPTRIPNNFKENFFANIARDANNNPLYLQNTVSWFDPTTAVCYWHYVSNNAPFPGVPDQFVAWNSRSGRWAHGYLNTPWVINNTQVGVQNGLFFDINNNLFTWTGPPAPMSLLTGYFGDASNLSQATKFRGKFSTQSPYAYPTNQNFTPLSTYALGQPDTVWPTGVLAPDGWLNYRATDRYHRGLLGTVGPCEISAIAAEFRISGVR